jgi:uncharacterized protein YaaR (DUF327 family)
MEEKMFEWMEKMYNKMLDMEEMIKSNGEAIEKNREAIEKNREAIEKNTASIIHLETKMEDHIKTLYDGYKQSMEGITRLEGKIDQLTEKVEKQEVEVRILKTAK